MENPALVLRDFAQEADKAEGNLPDPSLHDIYRVTDGPSSFAVCLPLKWL